METMPRCTVTELSNLLARQADCQVIDVREYAE
jgi:rhodanese-related sulfurtransferase